MEELQLNEYSSGKQFRQDFTKTLRFIRGEEFQQNRNKYVIDRNTSTTQENDPNIGKQSKNNRRRVFGISKEVGKLKSKDLTHRFVEKSPKGI